MSQNAPYNWADDENSGMRDPGRIYVDRHGNQTHPGPAGEPSFPGSQQARAAGGGMPRQSRNGSRVADAATAVGAAAGAFAGAASGSFVPPVNVNFNRGGGNGGGGNGGNGGGGGAASAGDARHQGDRMIWAIERIEFRSNRDIVALAKAINLLGRELHLILGMRAEELQGVLSTYKSPWYTLGSSSKIRARLVAAHLKVTAEAAKALGVGALKMAHAFDRHFVKPEQEAKRRKTGQPKKPAFRIED
ncbi:hypothetical protein [Streptomyces sp. 8L]|uniref:hypothetical protein n=1 Tax=Streptomyces sp. 8L TaxID=2877242 RepID=UPI001CD27AA6|nr:hypothetical protein [Streptomyces sp. 8L]MCA1222197.1 hypothetical protein [Streptomyces sp. 8L]